MPAPYLNLDTSAEETLFAAIVDILREDEALAREVQTWEVLDGTSAVLDPPATAQMPHIRILPSSRTQMGIAAADSYHINLALDVWIFTRALVRADRFNLWAAFRLALRGAKPFRATTVFAHLKTLGVYGDIEITRADLGHTPQLAADGGSRSQDLVAASQIIVPFLAPY